ncbi:MULTISPECIES: ABC transporter permease [unclassified Chelatococcus]|jgi:putative spermidine/putrescine transport system permease protein|uniref:ABC transporter permease n=1 Tax=unclassified Chelatococcus TaxID=2638111 RepID=UPI001BCC6DE5|nr:MULTISPECIES: ABC transporter permease [unclassified Chelatococcus]CAH1654223.1 putative spermidine/putrescine transport system permease protein [Hyphomicrobiales bacterium]MBS7740222.1 ABC transporter permease [Chelatococcus sp. HY11]MBX3544949.1 ABC transporter permease [Chelatococcus sp.]MCO5078537.1 ABC transporter permease [Chelatococcus sp.]CAH1685478.1 putative spermidine/putrescine transport system permease protein [Hyphomicrobiales bacterium]
MAASSSREGGAAARAKAERSAWLLLTPMCLLMAVAFILPVGLFLLYSFYRFRGGRLEETFTLETYWRFMTDELYLITIYDTLQLAVVSTLLCLVISYPLAYAMWRMRSPGLQKLIAFIVFAPVLVSVVVRSYGWTVVLADQGPVNFILTRLGLTSGPVSLVYNMTGTVISLAHVFLPFVVFPILASMLRLDPTLREAAEDLGASWWKTFRSITLPLTLPGVVAGAQICFTLSLGSFVTPAILGGGRVLVLPIQIYTATSDINWPVAAVGGLCLLVMAFIAVVAFGRLSKYSEAV